MIQLREYQQLWYSISTVKTLVEWTKWLENLHKLALVHKTSVNKYD